MHKIITPLQNLLRETDMTFEEIRAFGMGIEKLSVDEQVELYRYFNYDRTLIYPIYTHYMAKKQAMESGIDFEKAVENEIKFLESYIEGKRVGDEVII
jgi:hypothetical protein